MDNHQLSNLVHIQQASKQGRLVIFVGAGVSANSGVPTWSQLINEMKLECNIEYETDGLKIAQYYKDLRGDKEYMDKVKEILKYNNVIPNSIHKAILSLNPCHIITTNYDNLLEQEISNEYKQFTIIREDKDIPNMAYPNSLVKMHGDFDSDNIVLTEKDYYDYHKNFPLIRSFVLSLFASKLVLFVGFSFSDLNLKLIINELQSLLSNKMQRAYLITDDKPDYPTQNYFKQKGINIVYLEESDINKILINNNCPTDSIINSTKGKNLAIILQCIHKVKKNADFDLVSTIYQKIKLNSDEISSFGDAFKYFIPEQERPCWNPHSSGLQLNSPFFQGLAKQLKSYAGKKKFILEHQDIDLKELRKIAYCNYIYEIDDIKIIDSKFLYNINRYFLSFSASTYLYKFDYISLNKRLKELSSKELACDINDLEYPFTLYQLGDYYGAYNIYNQILPLAWRSQKYILYFACLYNIWAIRNGIANQMCFDKKVDYKSILDKINNIQLNEVLSRLTIGEEARKVFQSLLSFNSIGSRSIETEKLKEELHKQRKSAEKGGCSLNSNIISLLAKFEREFQFCHNNFLVCDNNMYYDSVCKNTIIGVLNSYATPNTSFKSMPFSASKINQLNGLCIHAMVFCIECDELKNIFNQYDIDSIELDEEAIRLINTYTENLSKADNIPFTNYDKFNRYVENLLFIISRIENPNFIHQSIYKIIIKYWCQILELSIDEKILHSLLQKYEPTSEESIELIDFIFQDQETQKRFDSCIRKLTYYLDKAAVKYTNLKPINSYDDDAAEYLYLLYPILEKDTQKEIYPLLQNGLKKLSSYLDWIVINKLPVTSTSQFEILINTFNPIDEYENSFCCNMLSNMRIDNSYSNCHFIIDQFSQNCECMKFFLNKISYTQYSNVCFEWILNSCKDGDINFPNNETYRKLVKSHLYDKNLSKELKEKLIDWL